MHYKNSKKQVLLLTPPFTQLNTPYPATVYLKGFLNTLGYSSFQVDLGLETTLLLFSSHNLENFFNTFDFAGCSDKNSLFIYHQSRSYIKRIDPVISFLQGKIPSLAHVINTRNYLPEGPRFQNLDDLDWAFGQLGIQDKAKHLATLFLEDLGDFITREVDPDFGFSRYAERISRTASDFSPIYAAIQTKSTVITSILNNLVEHYVGETDPDFVCITAPFPGNVLGAFLAAKKVKQIKPEAICVLGGGYVNTELRSVQDERVFEFFDYITLDDGEMPLQKILSKHGGKTKENDLKRTFWLKNNVVHFQNDCPEFDVPQREVGTPDYTDLKLHAYISVLEVLNPMHRKWSDGRWNKMTLAHGCYWGKCSFCDVSLDYIGRYEPVEAAMLCDRIEDIIRQTGEHGFHFVDEAAPPALLKDLALELIRRNITISWWTNIRFEKAFTNDLCRLLAASGCIAVTGGLEVASDRLLDLMKKGVTVAQVAQVAQSFTNHEIMVHAYLMYGFPTQTEQETIDSLEVVRQMMEIGIIQSGFWHLFAMTSHSPVGLMPADYSVMKVGPDFQGFADNDCYHEDPTGADHEKFSDGLRLSLFNYMQGLGFEKPLKAWFDFPTPKSSVPKDYIKGFLHEIMNTPKNHHFMVWIGGKIMLEDVKNSKNQATLTMYNQEGLLEIVGDNHVLHFLMIELVKMDPGQADFKRYLVEEFKEAFSHSSRGMTYQEFEHSYLLFQLRKAGLLFL